MAERNSVHYSVPFHQVPDALIDDPRTNVYHIAIFGALARHSDRHRACFPSFKRIADMCGCSRRKVVECIDELCELGWVEKKARAAGNGQKSNLYILRIAPAEQGEGSAPDAPDEESSAGDAPPVVHEVHGGGAHGAPEPETTNHTQLNQTAAQSAATLSKLHDSLAQHFQERMTAVFPHEGWSNIAAERKQCGVLANRTRALLDLTPFETDIELANAILSRYMALIRREKSDFWRNAPFTPSGLATRWDKVTTALAREYERAAKWRSA